MNDTLTAQREQIKPAQFTVDGPAFAEAIAPAVKVGSGGGNYAAVTLSFRDQRVTVAATDFETTVTAKIPVKGKKATNVAVRPQQLAKFAKTFPYGDVNVDISQEAVKFTVGQTELTMPPVWDAPTIAVPAFDDNVGTLESSRFVGAVKVCAPCASADQARPVLTGVKFDDGVSVATDSYRLAVYHDAPTGLVGLFPAAGLRIAAGMFADTDTVQYEVVGNPNTPHLVIRTADKQFSLRQIEGEYPNWRNLMSQPEATTTVHVARKALMTSLDKVTLAGDGDSVCRAQIEGDFALLSVITQDVATGFDPLPITVDGNVVLIGFNPRYLRQMLSGVDAEMLAIRIVDQMKPMLIVADEAERDSFELLQMPVRLP